VVECVSLQSNQALILSIHAARLVEVVDRVGFPTAPLDQPTEELQEDTSQAPDIERAGALALAPLNFWRRVRFGSPAQFHI